MNLWHDLSDPTMAWFFGRGALVALAISTMGSLLSILAVLKRLAFIGQGVSHAAFGGMGIVAILGLASSAMATFAIVLAFCLLAAWIVVRLSDRRTTTADTAIGIVLVASMALGAVLLREAMRSPPAGSPPPAWEAVLFGSLTSVAWPDVAVAWGVAAGVVFTAWRWRRSLVFWAFDEVSAEAFGIPSRAMKSLLLVLFTLAIVASMRLAGVVLATALLILPGATALLLSDRWWRVLAISGAVGVIGTVGGLILSYEADWPPGPAIVLALTLVFCAAKVRGLIRPPVPPNAQARPSVMG